MMELLAQTNAADRPEMLENVTAPRPWNNTAKRSQATWLGQVSAAPTAGAAQLRGKNRPRERSTTLLGRPVGKNGSEGLGGSADFSYWPWYERRAI
jgi:hypothetical protein